ncbi:MAG: hypothetical protein MJ233_04285 [Mycoplasmoidaceae bacterium]|nr:hypothetical protein [Mycoplasmoidaceae bacterium]
MTVSYLAKNGFEHFYDQLSTKIPGNDKAFIGYLSKYDIYGITDLAEARKAFDINSTTTISATPFD